MATACADETLADETLLAKLDAVRQQAGVASMAVVLVERDGGDQVRVSGVTDWESGRAVDEQSIFRIGSISKMFTGMVLLKAVDEGVVDLDAPLRQYLDESLFDNPWADSHPVTLAQLMEHTAGWYDMSGMEFDSSDPKPLSLREAMDLNPASRRSHWPPGMHSEYSNSGSGLAAYVLEQAAKVDFEDYAARTVFAPLGMETATYRLTPAVREHLVQGYDRDARTPIRYWHFLYRPAGGLNMNPRDMAPAIRMLLNRGRVDGKAFLSEQEVWRLEHPRTTLAAKHGLDFGYGLGIYQTQHQGHSLFGHGGDADGYLSHFAYSPEAGRGYFVVITAFNHRPLNRMEAMLNDWVVAELPEKPKPTAVAVKARDIAAYAGEYYRAATRFPRSGWESDRLQVRWRSGRLYTDDGREREKALLPLDEQRFRRPWETTASAIFIPQPDGSVILQGGMGNWRRPVPEGESVDEDVAAPVSTQ